MVSNRGKTVSVGSVPVVILTKSIASLNVGKILYVGQLKLLLTCTIIPLGFQNYNNGAF